MYVCMCAHTHTNTVMHLYMLKDTESIVLKDNFKYSSGKLLINSVLEH